jgi:hypothetical protein
VGDGGLNAQDLVDGAITATGLDDFGAGSWREGLERLVEALNGEARLNDLGHAAFTERIGGSLRGRLQVVDWRSSHPEVADEVVGGPVIIVGLPRTGTTALSNLLAQDPDTRSLRVWESASPIPPPQPTGEDERIALVQAGLDMFHELVPAVRPLHDDTATSTAEGIDLLGMSFAAYHVDGMARVPSYVDWLLDQPLTEAYAFHHDVLQVLQSRCPPTRWHLKNPGDLFWLDTIVATYPDVRFVWTHRDPAAVLPSVCDLVAIVTGMCTDELDPLALGREQVDFYARAVERGLALRDQLGEERFVDLQVADLVADPVAAVGALYEGVGWTFTDAAERGIAGWWADNPPAKHGEHHPDPARYGLVADEVRERFGPYLDRFAIGGGRLT